MIAHRHLQRAVLLILCMAFCVACSSNTATAQNRTKAGEGLFNRWCIGCHAVAPGGAAKVGPNLMDVATMAATNPQGLTPETFLRESIVNPNAYILPGYMPYTMPMSYQQQLGPEQIEALVAYMLTLKNQP